VIPIWVLLLIRDYKVAIRAVAAALVQVTLDGVAAKATLPVVARVECNPRTYLKAGNVVRIVRYMS
jgi:hypothetical protein